MFAKGPRFPSDKPSEIPGPGHYRLPEESRHDLYKKGAFLEKANRFGIEKGSDVPGPGTYNTAPRESNARAGSSKPMPSSYNVTHLQQEVDTLKSQHAKLQKEYEQAVRKYEEKLMHNDNTIRSLVKDNVALQSQVSTQQKEYRTVCQRETALRAALEKIELTNKSQLEQARKFPALQRRMDDLEKIHADDRKKHQSETEHLRGELDASRKTVTEQSERSSMLRKHLEDSETRIKELKKAIIEDQSHLRELRTKLRDAEEAKRNASSSLSELHQMKKNLQNLEVKHKAELNDKDAKIAQQEKILLAEWRRREALELRVHEAETQADVQAREMCDRHQRLENELESVRRSAEEASSATADEVIQLNNLRATMTQVAKAYGDLTASSVSHKVYRQLQLDHACLQLRTIRVERRLADRETLTEQLADYCRRATEEKAFLSSMLLDMEKEFGNLRSGRTSSDSDISPNDGLLSRIALRAIEEAHRLQDAITQSDLQTSQALASLYRSEFEELLVAYAVARRQEIEQDAVTARLVDACTERLVAIEALQSDYRTAEAALSRQTIETAQGVSQIRALEEQIDVYNRKMAEVEEALKKERDVNARLAHAAHISEKNEEMLRYEVDGLVEELQDTMRYREAHSDLLAEVVELIQRNELAEAEAERLGKFNAEILGHKNPQQKIFYLDRIRRELADAKQQLMKSTRSREDLMADNAALQHEVLAYKSIVIPPEHKPRDDRIRVERLPLVPRNINMSTKDIVLELTPPNERQMDTLPMRLDEVT